MQGNLSVPDRYVRLTTGVLAIASASSNRRQSWLTKTFLCSFGAMKIAEGVTGWCPLKSATQMLRERSDSSQSSQSSQRNTSPQGGTTANVPNKSNSGHDHSAISSFLMDADDEYERTQ